MQLFVIACFTRLKVLRPDLRSRICGQPDLCFRCLRKKKKKRERELVISSDFHQVIHIANISGILM